MVVQSNITTRQSTFLPESDVVQRVILHGISWNTYRQLLSEHTESSGTHFAFDQGTLEIMVLSAKHEALKHTLALLVDVLAEELDIDVYGLGSTTFNREDLSRGFEPDACFYIEHEALIRGRDEIDLAVDPAPDLVIEVDITSPSLDKYPIFAALGIAEVWRYDGQNMTISILENGTYVERLESRALPPVTGGVLKQFLHSSQQLKRTAWLRQVRKWIQQVSSDF
ncbi:Uma2 family endonuclease [Chloroflexi bacterium TSY]|nr:Uma2 family endonuclease [Chloroflexi bacterium TSY]